MTVLYDPAATSALNVGAVFGTALSDALLHKSAERAIRLIVGGRA